MPQMTLADTEICFERRVLRFCTICRCFLKLVTQVAASAFFKVVRFEIDARNRCTGSELEYAKLYVKFA